MGDSTKSNRNEITDISDIYLTKLKENLRVKHTLDALALSSNSWILLAIVTSSFTDLPHDLQSEAAVCAAMS